MMIDALVLPVRRTVMLAAALALAFAWLAPAVAGAQAVTPFVAYGMGVEGGATVGAHVDGVLCGDTTADAQGNWLLYVAATDPCRPVSGDTLTFTLDGHATTAASIWIPGGAPADVAGGIPLRLATGAGRPATQAAPAGGGFLTALVPGVNVAVWSGGSVQALTDAAEDASATAVWAVIDGDWFGLIPGAPEFLNAEFLAAFPGGEVDTNQPFVVVAQ